MHHYKIKSSGEIHFPETLKVKESSLGDAISTAQRLLDARLVMKFQTVFVKSNIVFTETAAAVVFQFEHYIPGNLRWKKDYLVLIQQVEI